MDHALPRRLAADRGQGSVGEVGGEDDIVLAHRAAQQLQRPAADAQAEARQQARVIVEQAVTFAGDVAEGVGHHEGVALLEREQARRACADHRVGAGLRHQPASSSAAGRLRAILRVAVEPPVQPKVVARHHLGREPPLEAGAGPGAGPACPAGRPPPPPRPCSSTMKPLTPCSTTSGTEPQRQAITGVPQAMASIITRPNGSGQSIGNRSASALPRNSDFSASPISPTILDQRIGEQWLDLLVEVGPVDRVDLGRDLQRACPCGARSRSPGRGASPARFGQEKRDSRSLGSAVKR